MLNVEQALKKAGMGAERVLTVLAQILMDRAAEAQRGRTGVAATTLMGRSAEKVHAEEKTTELITCTLGYLMLYRMFLLAIGKKSVCRPQGEDVKVGGHHHRG